MAYRNKKIQKAKQKKYQQTHKGIIAIRKNHYYQINKDRIAEYSSNYRAKQRRFLLGFLGGKCVRCGNSDERVLCFDHINSDGYKDRKKLGSENVLQYYVARLDKAKKKLQILCANCNMIKTREAGENGRNRLSNG